MHDPKEQSSGETSKMEPQINCLNATRRAMQISLSIPTFSWPKGPSLQVPGAGMHCGKMYCNMFRHGNCSTQIWSCEPLFSHSRMFEEREPSISPCSNPWLGAKGVSVLDCLPAASLNGFLSWSVGRHLALPIHLVVLAHLLCVPHLVSCCPLHPSLSLKNAGNDWWNSLLPHPPLTKNQSTLQGLLQSTHGSC